MKNKHKRSLLSSLMAGVLGAVLVWPVSASDKGEVVPQRILKETVVVRAPVWTEKLGNVSLDDYTREELSAMVREYWTPERMRNAIPADMPVLKWEMGDALHNHILQHDGEEPLTLVTEPMLPIVVDGFPGLNRSKSGSAASLYSATNGKIFFREAGTNLNKVCSGAAINSSSKRLVATAAHCVHGGPGSAGHQNVRFVPYYYYGQEPFGSFDAFASRLFSDWIEHGATWQGFDSDVAFITTHDNQYGWRLVDFVGGHGFSYGGSRKFEVSLFGYPSNLDSGMMPKACAGTSGSRLQGGYNFVSISGCNFGLGASGGPWLTGYSDNVGIGILKTVSSWIPSSTDRSHINGPYFDANVLSLFNNANDDWTTWGGGQ